MRTSLLVVAMAARFLPRRNGRMPWAEDKHHLTQTYAWFLVAWATRFCWKDVGEAFRISWDSVFRWVEMAVNWNRAHQELSGDLFVDPRVGDELVMPP